MSKDYIVGTPIADVKPGDTLTNETMAYTLKVLSVVKDGSFIKITSEKANGNKIVFPYPNDCKVNLLQFA